MILPHNQRLRRLGIGELLYKTRCRWHIPHLAAFFRTASSCACMPAALWVCSGTAALSGCLFSPVPLSAFSCLLPAASLSGAGRQDSCNSRNVPEAGGYGHI